MLTKCCCVVPLKAGVVFVTLFWLASGISIFVKCILDLVSPLSVKEANMLKFGIAYTIMMIVICVLTMIGATFGLYVIIYCRVRKISQKTSAMWLRYSIIADFIAGIDIIGHIAAISAFVLCKSSILGRCYDKTSNSLCDREYGNYLAIAIFYAIASGILSVHFAVVISAYYAEIAEIAEITEIPEIPEIADANQHNQPEIIIDDDKTIVVPYVP